MTWERSQARFLLHPLRADQAGAVMPLDFAQVAVLWLGSKTRVAGLEVVLEPGFGQLDRVIAGSEGYPGELRDSGLVGR
jgi:hypothetical protein